MSFRSLLWKPEPPASFHVSFLSLPFLPLQYSINLKPRIGPVPLRVFFVAGPQCLQSPQRPSHHLRFWTPPQRSPPHLLFVDFAFAFAFREAFEFAFSVASSSSLLLFAAFVCPTGVCHLFAWMLIFSFYYRCCVMADSGRLGADGSS